MEETTLNQFYLFRYPEMTNAQFTKAEQALKSIFKIDVTKVKPPEANAAIPDFDFKHFDDEKLRKELKLKGIELSTSIEDRFYRSFGQSAQDLVKLLHARIPDVVVWPTSHEDVEHIVRLANEHDAVIIPFGGDTEKVYQTMDFDIGIFSGGTNVTSSVNCLEDETRTIVSLGKISASRQMFRSLL